MKQILWKSLMLLLLVFTLTNCSSKSNYTSVIPKNASLVIGFDFRAMYEKSGVKGTKEGEQLIEFFTKLLISQFGNEKNIKEYIENPEKTGLKLTDKVYVFSSYQSKFFGLVMHVSSVSRLKKLIESENKQLNKESGIYYQVEDNAVIAFNSNTLLIVSSQYPSDIGLKDQAIMLMKEESKENSSSEIKQVIEKKDDIDLYLDLNCVPDEYLSEVKMGLPADFKPEDVKFFASVIFEKGRVNIKLNNITKSPKIVDIFNQLSKVTSQINGKFMSLFPSNTLLWLGSNIKGKELLDLLEQNPAIKNNIQFSEIPVDLERVISSIQGDVAIGINSFATPSFTIYAEINDDTFLQNTLDELNPFVDMAMGMASLNKIGNNIYVFKAYPSIQVWFGVEENMLFVSNSQFAADHFTQAVAGSLNNNEWRQKVTSNRGFIVLNCAQLISDSMYSGLSRDNPINLVLSPFDYIAFNKVDWQNGELNLVLKDKSANLLEQIIKLVASLN
ncbi:MAG: DUF4836 family protein [Phocaeicola sp.]|uniref:DUF4836 family protein n=1 Tax=Phocaeicola sp. TaxID=2773926 RepID=UPI003FA15ADA